MAKFRKKPVVIEAMQLLPTNISDVYRFIYGEDSIKNTCMMAHDHWYNFENSVIRDGLKLKTPESDGETQVASIGDYIFKAYSSNLGWHYYPVKPDYVAENYELVEE